MSLRMYTMVIVQVNMIIHDFYVTRQTTHPSLLTL